MFDPILDSIKENNKQLGNQLVERSTESMQSVNEEIGLTGSGEKEIVLGEGETDETSSDIPEKVNIGKEELGSKDLNSDDDENDVDMKEEEEEDHMKIFSKESICSFFKENLNEVIALPDGAPISRKQSHYSLIRKLLLFKSAMFPNVLELFNIDYSYKKNSLFKELDRNYMFETAIGDHIVHYDLRYNVKTEHINYMTFLVFSLLSSKAITRPNKDRLISDPYFAFSTVYQVILYNFSILNSFNTFQYNSQISSQKKKFHPLLDIDLEADKDVAYNSGSVNYPFKPEFKPNNDEKVIQEKPLGLEYQKTLDYLWKIPFGQGNFKPDDGLVGHPQADKLNGFQVLFHLNKWCLSDGTVDSNGIETLVNSFISLIHKLNVEMKFENLIVALILWLTAIISYSKESDLEFHESMLKMIFEDESFTKFDELNYNTSFDDLELEICNKEYMARQELRTSKGIASRQGFKLKINDTGNIELAIEPKLSIVREAIKEHDVHQAKLPHSTEILTPGLYTPKMMGQINEKKFVTANHSCVDHRDYFEPKHIINVSNTKSKNNFNKQLNKEINAKLNYLYKEQSIDQLIYDLGKTHAIARKIRTDSNNYINLFDKHEINYVSLTSGKFGGRTKKNPKINDSVVGFQTDMVQLFRMNKKLLIKRASRLFA
ncbi:hypothetical protein QEN19_003924 [Hanseniaspora menglaensis]